MANESPDPVLNRRSFGKVVLATAATAGLAAAGCSDQEPKAKGDGLKPEQVDLIAFEELLAEIRASGPQLDRDTVAAANRVVNQYPPESQEHLDFALSVNTAIQEWLVMNYLDSPEFKALVPNPNGQENTGLMGAAELFRTTGATTPTDLLTGQLTWPTTGQAAVEALGGLNLLNQGRTAAGASELAPSDFTNGRAGQKIGLGPNTERSAGISDLGLQRGLTA